MSAFYSTQRYWKKCLSSLNNSPWYSSISCISKLVDYLNVYYNRTFNIRFLDGLWVVDESSDLYVVVQSLSRFQLFVTPWTEARQALLSCSISWSLLKLMSIELVVLSNITSSVALFSSCPQSFPVPGSFTMSWLFASGGQSIGTSDSASIPSVNIQDWFPLGLTGLISLQSKLFSRSCLLQHHSSKASILWRLGFFMVQLSHPYMPTGKTIALTRHTFVGKGMSLLF